MSTVVAEARKLLTLRSTQGAALAALLLVPLLTWLNARAVRGAIDGLRTDATTDPSGVGVAEALLAVAACAALGVLSVGQEHRGVPEDLGGGRQALSTALAMPRRLPRQLVSLGLAAALSGAVVALALAEGAIVAGLVLGPHAPAVDAARWQLGGRVVVYAALLALLAGGVTLALRHGLVPLVYLVGSSTVVSVGYLLAQRWSWAWYLPDALAPSIVRVGVEQPGMPSAGMAVAAMAGWTALACGAGLLLDARRDV